MTGVIDELKTAAELIEKAAELVREATKETSLPSVAARQCVEEQTARIRLKLMLLRRDLTVLHGIANGRKPRRAGREAEGRRVR